MGPSDVAGQGLAGSVTRCEKEGEDVVIPGITDDPCISCSCKNMQVECEKVKCLKLEGCHTILFDLPTDRCCELCKGCSANGTEYRSGDVWTDPKDPCRQRQCWAGVITETTTRCFAHCHSPVPVQNQCCPVCTGCVFRGQEFKEGANFTLPADVCTQCLCKKGNIACTKISCPVLNCPQSVIYQPRDECCPKCKGMRKIFDVKARGCYYAKQIYRLGQVFWPDKCTKCTCTSGTSLCLRVTCPPLDCALSERKISDDGCCEVCPVRRPCKYHGTMKAHLEQWSDGPCISCSCKDGVTYCQRQRCSNSLWCPQGYQLRLSEDSCCPKCVEHDAVCTVFGDPHYRTFDGRMFNFQGSCKYLLVRDCQHNTFNIKVRNGVRFTSGFAWTQMLAVLIGHSRVSLLQNLRVKVDRRRVSLPYVRPGQFSVRRLGRTVRLRSERLGLEVLWDGDSLAEVTVPARYKNRLCGLCGNYNGLKLDDLRGADGVLHRDEEAFGRSWQVGGRKACMSRPPAGGPVADRSLCATSRDSRQRAHRVCSVFYENSLLPCRRLLPIEPYVSSCITDMCDCPEGRYCACESLKAYLSQCRRAGAGAENIPWERHGKCFSSSLQCPPGAKPVLCADACPRTCSNLNAVTPECPEACDAGCLCDEGQVFHEGACVLPELCPHAGGSPS